MFAGSMMGLWAWLASSRIYGEMTALFRVRCLKSGNKLGRFVTLFCELGL